MYIDVKEDPELNAYIRRSQPPVFEDIVKFAKARGVSSASDLWAFYDFIIVAWNENKSTEGDWTY